MRTDGWRPDVGAFLLRVRPIMADATERSKWRVYESFRDELSRICGWNAKDEKYDHPLYEGAHAEMIRRLGL